MRIGINGRHLGPNKTGVGRYLLSLLEVWQRDSGGHQFFVYTSNEVLEPEDQAIFSPSSPIQHRLIARPFGSFHLWYNWSLPRAMQRDRIDWFFSPDYFCPPLLSKSIRRSMSIHDISFISHPEWFPRLYQLSCILYSRWPARMANIIFTISNFSAQEIKKHYTIPPEKIVVTPLAVDGRFQPATDASPHRPSLPGLDADYFLFVGKILNRRHVREMLLAFQTYVQQHPNSKMQFVIRGRDETHPAQQISQLIKKINTGLSRTAILHVEHLSDQLLVELYQKARAFFYLSSYEGFGLPVLEALACGTPTVTVQASSIPEVAGSAAVYVDPTNIPALADTMHRLTTDQSWWTEKKQASQLQAQQTSWPAVARTTLLAIEKAWSEQKL